MRTQAIQAPWAKIKRVAAADGSAPSSAADTRLGIWPLAALAAIVLLAGALRFANLSALGYGNAYYTATVTAMLKSWHNFFFVAAEPGGAVSVDKPPVGFWLQAASAFIFGVNTFGVMLPQLLAGMASVVVLYHLVQRRFGQVAGLVAALVLALTPVTVATDRNNTIDSTLVLTLLLAAWAFIKATESGKLKYLLLGAGLVGIGFNIKMLQAYLPLPAFYALYLLGSAERLPRKIASAALATALLLVVSASWITVVDLTPASQRPYVGSSGTNSAWNLAIGYNGIQRLLGMGRSTVSVTSLIPNLIGGNGGAAGGFNSGRGGFNGGGPGGFGMFGTGQPGPLRLFTGSLSNEISWLLPFGLFAGLLLAFRSRLHWPLSPKHQAVVLWGGWLLTTVVFFSIAGFFHPYYLVMLAPPLAALVGLGVAELWQMYQQRWPQRSTPQREAPPPGEEHWRTAAAAVALAAVAVGGTIMVQFKTAMTFTSAIWWLPVVISAFGVGLALLVYTPSQWQRVAQAGFACLIGAMLITPGIWSGLTTLYSHSSLPEAYAGRSTGQSGFGPGNMGGGSQIDQTLLAYLQANTQGMKYLMAVASANQGASYVIATGRPVLYLGGFSGQDQVETADSLAKLVANGELRYIYQGGQGGPGGRGGGSDINSWVTSTCKAVQANAGRGGGGLGTLYDCQAS